LIGRNSFIKLFKNNSLQYAQTLRFVHLLLINIVLAKTGFSVEQIGYFELIFLITNAVSFFWLGGFTKGFLFRYNQTEDKQEKKNFAFHLWLILNGLALLTVLTLWIFKHKVYGLTNNSVEIPYYGQIIVFVFFNMVSVFTDLFLFAKNKKKLLIGFSSLYYFIQLLGFIILLLINRQIAIAFRVFVGMSALRYLFLVWQIKRGGALQFNAKYIKQLTSSAVPLVLSAFIMGSVTYIDGFIVTAFFDLDQLAIFRFGSRELPIFLILVSAASLEIINHLAKPQSSKDFSFIKNSSLKLLNLTFFISILLIPSSEVLFKLFFNEQFVESAAIFNVYLLIAVIRCIFPQSILIAQNRNTAILYISITELVINVISSIVLLRYFGLIGIAMGSVIANIFEKAILALYVRNVLGINWREYMPSRLFLYLALLFTAVLLKNFLF
jgi:O-antigen/teichoic acid export membrane protein